MGIVNINAYRRTCDNCLWHDAAHGACKHPGGWEWDKKFSRCITFEWRNGHPAVKHQQTHARSEKGEEP